MSNYSLFQDEKKCISCRSCEVQCKINKGLATGPRPGKIITAGPVTRNGRVMAKYVFTTCRHCEDPFCVQACPVGAVQKRPSDGIVFIDQELCVGCQSCIMACPWGAPQWDEEKGVVVKCDYCKDRLDAGLEPACVTACPTGSLIFISTENIPSIKRERIIRRRMNGRAVNAIW